MSLKLYGNPKSRAFRAIWALTEAELPFELIKLDFTKQENKSTEYLQLNPNGKVPTLIDNGQVLYESPAICVHIADKTPEKGLMPKVGSYQRSLANQWISYCMAELEAHLWLISRHTFVLPEAERKLDVVRPFALKEFNKSMTAVEAQLEKGNYLLGEQFTVADILMAQTLLWAALIEGANISSPVIQAYIKRCKERPLYPNIKNYL